MLLTVAAAPTPFLDLLTSVALTPLSELDEALAELFAVEEVMAAFDGDIAVEPSLRRSLKRSFTIALERFFGEMGNYAHLSWMRKGLLIV